MTTSYIASNHCSLEQTLKHSVFATMSYSTAGQSPLQQVLPWSNSNKSNNHLGDTCPHTILIQDSIETSARFLLHLVAKDIPSPAKINSNNSVHRNVLWIACSPCQNERLILNSRNKLASMGSTSARLPGAPLGSVSTSKGSTDSFRVCNVTHEFESAMDCGNFNPLELIKKQLYQDTVKSWVEQTTADEQLILVEDVSALATLVGERLAYAFICQIKALQQKHAFSLVVSCSGDGPDEESSWVGAGGRTNHGQSQDNYLSWESSLTELADWVVDVVPLATGMSRNVHGRMIITPKRHAISPNPCTINYCLGENQVFATRVQHLQAES